jgi:hypothetical protein
MTANTTARHRAHARPAAETQLHILQEQRTLLAQLGLHEQAASAPPVAPPAQPAPLTLEAHIASRVGARHEPRLTIIDACDDPDPFARWFNDRATWQVWFAFLAALFALPLSPEQEAIHQRCTGRGRRAGKSFVLALCAVFLAGFHDYKAHSPPASAAPSWSSPATAARPAASFATFAHC